MKKVSTGLPNLLSQTIRHAVFAIAVVASFSGCTVAQMAVESSREQAKDIRVTTSQDYDSAKAINYKTVAVFVRSVGNDGVASGFSGFGFTATGGGASEVIQSRLAATFIRQGYDVLEAGDIERMATADEVDKPTERIILRLSREAGADVIVIGIAESGSQQKIGLFGVGGGIEAGIVSASMKFVDAESGKPIAIISSDYEEPKTANEVVDDLAPYIDRIMKGSSDEEIDDG